jgi:hypothetical protein
MQSYAIKTYSNEKIINYTVLPFTGQIRNVVNSSFSITQNKICLDGDDYIRRNKFYSQREEEFVFLFILLMDNVLLLML